MNKRIRKKKQKLQKQLEMKWLLDMAVAIDAGIREYWRVREEMERLYGSRAWHLGRDQSHGGLRQRQPRRECSCTVKKQKLKTTDRPPAPHYSEPKTKRQALWKCA